MPFRITITDEAERHLRGLSAYDQRRLLWPEKNFMDIKTIPLSELASDPLGTLNECALSGQPLIVELPGQRLVAIQSLDPDDEDSLTSDLLESNGDFRALVSKSKDSPRKPFAQS